MITFQLSTLSTVVSIMGTLAALGAVLYTVANRYVTQKEFQEKLSSQEKIWELKLDAQAALWEAKFQHALDKMSADMADKIITRIDALGFLKKKELLG